MNKLIQVSQILYERDIIEKNKEIAELKQKLKEFETPTVIHDSFGDWEQKKYTAFKIIEKSVAQSITNNRDEFENIVHNKTMSCIAAAIKDALIMMSNNSVWSHTKANELIVAIEAFLSGYKTVHMLNNGNKLKIARIIQQFIKYQFEREDDSFAYSNLIITNSNSIYNSRWSESTRGIFIEIARFKCILCGNICKLSEITPEFTCRKLCCELMNQTIIEVNGVKID